MEIPVDWLNEDNEPILTSELMKMKKMSFKKKEQTLYLVQKINDDSPLFASKDLKLDGTFFLY